MLARRTMVGLVLGAWLVLANSAFAQPPAENKAPETEKAATIRQLIELTDAARLEAIFSRAFIDRITQAISLFRPNMDAHSLAVVEQEARDVIRERIESGDLLYSVLYPVYQKHFSLIELSQLVEFYQSPLGQKMARVSPQLLSESLQLGSEWGLSLVPEIAARVRARLAEDNNASGRH